jgi:hypothetical protein
VPPLVSPWGNTPPAAGPDPLAAQMKDASDFMAARRANAQLSKQTVSSQAKEAVEQMNARRANAKLTQAKAQSQAQQDQYSAADAGHAAYDRLVKGQARDAQDLMAARRANEKLQQTRAGTAQADALARTSPLIGEVGGLGAVRNPEFARVAGKYIAAANAIKKLTAEPSGRRRRWSIRSPSGPEDQEGERQGEGTGCSAVRSRHRLHAAHG